MRCIYPLFPVDGEPVDGDAVHEARVSATALAVRHRIQRSSVPVGPFGCAYSLNNRTQELNGVSIRANPRSVSRYVLVKGNPRTGSMLTKPNL